MRASRPVVLPAVVLAALLAQLACSKPPSSPALTGIVRSGDDGPLEGVLVSAKRLGSTITTTVVTDAQGRYAFPSTRLAPGRYDLFIRAVRYELDGPDRVVIPAAAQRPPICVCVQRTIWRRS